MHKLAVLSELWDFVHEEIGLGKFFLDLVLGFSLFISFVQVVNWVLYVTKGISNSGEFRVVLIV